LLTPKAHHLAFNPSDDVVLKLIDVDLQTDQQAGSQTITAQPPQAIRSSDKAVSSSTALPPVAILSEHTTAKKKTRTTVAPKRKTTQQRLSPPQPSANRLIPLAKKTEQQPRSTVQSGIAHPTTTQQANHQPDVEDSNQTLMMVRKHLESYKYYPSSARRRGIEGHVDVSFRLMSHGTADQVNVLHGSGYAVLDHAALEAVYRAQPFPVGNGQYRFRLTFKRL